MVTSIIKKSQLEGANRLDAEYFCCQNLFKNDYLLGGEIIDYVQYGTSEDLNEEYNGFPVLRLNEINNVFIDEPSKYCNKITKQTFENLKLKKGDVLICRTNGNPKLVGKSGIIMENADIAFASYLYRIKPNENINSASLVTYLNSKIGRSEIEKNMMVSNQTNFSPAKFREIKIPIIPSDMQHIIANLIDQSYEQQNQSKELYSQAENLLLEELRLMDYKVEDDLSFVVNLSEVKSSRRADPEFFQPKYQKLFSIIKSHSPKLLGEIVSIKKGFEPGSDAYQEEGKKFIRVSNLTKLGFDDGDQKYISDDLFNKLRASFEPKEGEILLTKDATPGISYLIKEPFEGIISGGILRLKTKVDIDPEYLSLVISSIVGQDQAQRDAGGAIIVHWRPEQIKNMTIPILPKESQRQIADFVRKSHEARKKSKELLEEAKRKVEEMIEKGGE